MRGVDRPPGAGLGDGGNFEEGLCESLLDK